MTNKTEALKNLGHRPDQIKALARKDSPHHRIIKGSDAGVGESTGQTPPGSSMGGSTLGSANATSLVATAWVHAEDPASGTSSTFSPAALYQPIFIAMANGAAAEETVLAHQPTRTFVSAGVGGAASAMKAMTSEHTSERFINRPLPWRA